MTFSPGPQPTSGQPHGTRFNPQAVFMALSLLIAREQTVELRMLWGRKHVSSGYFRNLGKLVEVAGRYDGRGRAIYITANACRPELLARANERMIDDPGVATGDLDIARRTRYRLEACVFNDQHRFPDAALFQFANSALAYVCLHDSCRDKTWHDVRDLLEPGWRARGERPRKERTKQGQGQPPTAPEAAESAADEEGPRKSQAAESAKVPAFALRPYEVEARDAVLAEWERGVLSTLITAAVGTGKTEMGSPSSRPS